MSHAEKRLNEIKRGRKNVYKRPKRTRVVKPQGPRGRVRWPQVMWAYSNFGNLNGVRRTRAEAIKAAEDHADAPWSQCRAYMEVWKCSITPHHEEHGK